MGRFGFARSSPSPGARLGALFLASLAIGITTGPSIGRTGSLHDAARAGDVAAIDMLLEGGADIEETDFVLGTPLHVAIASGAPPVVAHLLEKGASVGAAGELNGSRPLHLAAELGLIEIISILLDRGAEIDATDQLGGTALFRAVAAGRGQAAERLVARGADVGIADGTTGMLPLHKAAETGQIAVVLLLLDADVDINARDSLGMTALHYAATPVSLSNAGGPELIHVLVERGANLEARNGSGQTPLDYAQARSGYGAYAEIAQILQALAAR